MSEPTYTIALTESERTAMARVLGALVTKLINAPLQIDEAANGAVLSPPPQNPPVASPAAAQPTTPELRDRWARDRKGNEVPWPTGPTGEPCEEREVHLWKAEIVKRKDASKTAFMKLAWDSPARKGSVDASCFDPNLFPWLLAALKASTVTLYVVRNGEYLNVVGERA